MASPFEKVYGVLFFAFTKPETIPNF